MQSSRLYKKSALIIFIRSISIPIRYILNWFAAFFYGAFVIGAFSTTRSFLDILTIVAGLGGDRVMLKALAHSYQNKKFGKKHFSRIFNALFVFYFFISLLFAILIFGTSTFIAKFYNKVWLVPFLRITAFTLPFVVLLILVNQAFKAINKPLLATLFETTIYNTLVLFFIIILNFVINKRFKIYGFHIGFLLGTLFTFAVAIALFLLIVFKSGFSIKQGILYWLGSKRRQHLLKFLNLALPILLINTIYLYLLNLDRILLPKFVSGVDVGIYYIAGRVAGLVQIIGIGLLAITPSIIVRRLNRYGIKKVIHFIYRMSIFSFIISILSLLLWIPLAPFLLHLFGTEYNQALSFIRYMLIGAVFFNVGTVAGQGVILINKQNILLKYLIVCAIVLTILGWQLISRFSLIGAAYFFIIVQATISLANWLALVSPKKTGHGAIG